MTCLNDRFEWSTPSTNRINYQECEPDYDNVLGFVTMPSRIDCNDVRNELQQASLFSFRRRQSLVVNKFETSMISTNGVSYELDAIRALRQLARTRARPREEIARKKQDGGDDDLSPDHVLPDNSDFAWHLPQHEPDDYQTVTPDFQQILGFLYLPDSVRYDAAAQLLYERTKISFRRMRALLADNFSSEHVSPDGVSYMLYAIATEQQRIEKLQEKTRRHNQQRKSQSS